MVALTVFVGVPFGVGALPGSSSRASRASKASAGAFEKCPFRSNARQDTDAHEHPEEMTGEVLRWHGARGCALRLTGLDAFKKERLDADKHACDDLPKSRAMRRDFQGRVHQHAAPVLAIAQRPAQDLVEEG